MSAHNYDSLLATLDDDAQILCIGEVLPQLSKRSSQLDLATWDRLPEAAQRYDLIVLGFAAHQAPDAFGLVQDCAARLKAGGWLLIEDVTVPDDDRAAYFVQSFYRLRAGSLQRYYAPYAWEGMLLDAGLQAQWQAVHDSRLLLAEWAADCADEILLRLQILLKQAPEPVRAWWRPAALGSEAASFVQQSIVMAAQKP